MFFIFIFLFLIVGRLNSSVLGYEILNPDEVQMMANAIGIVSRDFNLNFFDGNSSGIINSLVLAWPALVGIDITFLSTRLTAIFILSLIIFFTYKIIKKNLNFYYSLILTLPIIFLFSFSRDPDFIHYSSELVSTLILVFSYWLFTNNKNNSEKIYYMISVLLSLIFFSKIQFGPASLIFFMVLLTNLYIQKVPKKKIFITILFFSIFPLMFLSSHYFSNTLQDFIINYIHYPTDYLTIMKNPLPEIDLTKPELIKENNFFPQDNYLKHLTYNSALHYFYIYFIFSLILFVKFFEIRKFKKLINKELILLIILIFSLAFCILITGRNFRHYLIVLMPFIPILISIGINSLFEKNNKFKINYLYYSFIFLLFIFSASIYFEEKKFYSKNSPLTNLETTNINFKNPRTFSYLKIHPSGSIYIWGWMPKWYVLSGLKPVSRSSTSEKLMRNNRYKEYYQKRLINDFKINTPNLIVDFEPTSQRANLTNFFEFSKLLKKEYVKLNVSNGQCPGYYLKKENYNFFQRKNINYYFKKNIINLNKLNDFSVTEDSAAKSFTCEDAVNFNINDDNQFKIYFNKRENIKEIYILASKKNIKEDIINIKFLNNKKIIQSKKVLLKKHPFWSKIILDAHIESDSLLFDIRELKLSKNGINEVKVFRE
jgi:hypothetical protein